ncbi:MAG: DUF3322 domain-containing protein [Candidatus Eremiobacteraeota bacterium]|nr:DUF3322 domain-containing protein [Candidatus Eremiobacteraeota bacterium]
MTDQTWTTPAQIVARLRRFWTRGDLLRAELGAASSGPLELPLTKPGTAELSERFTDVRAWIRSLEEGSKSRRGFGYDIVWSEVNNRVLGSNRVPARVRIATNDDALRLIGTRRQAQRFSQAAVATLAAFPELQNWISRKPLVLVEHEADWERVLGVLSWFRNNTRPAIYLRQLDIPGVDTKFIESRKGLLAELLDLVLPAAAIDASAIGSRAFDRRYGLLPKPALIRFRTLDDRLLPGGYSDLAVPVDEFARVELDVDAVYITENDANGLAFPPLERSIVIFGLGYGVESLSRSTWLRSKALRYWGDIDTHGFVMLDRLRGLFPHVTSLLMDRDTFMSHRDLWTHEAAPYREPLARLTPAEQSLFDDLREARFVSGARLEQERVAFHCVERAIVAFAEQRCRAT